MRYVENGPRAMEKLSLFLALAASALAPARVLAQSNQGGGQQLNPNSSLNSIVNGGPTGVAPPIHPVTVPVTPASDPNAPASLEKDRPPKGPLKVVTPRARKKLSDKALAKKVHREIVHDLTLPQGSQGVKAEASGGKVTLTGTVLTEDDKYKIAAKAAELAGAENVVNLINVTPAPPPR